MNRQDAARAGGRAGLLSETEPAGFDAWPASAKAGYFEQYARGRRCRLRAEGQATPSAPRSELSAYFNMSRTTLTRTFIASPALQREFLSPENFVAFIGAGRRRRIHPTR